MIVALATFVLLNVLVDSYFYLMLLVVVMVYVSVANDWWARIHRNLVFVARTKPLRRCALREPEAQEA